MCVCWAGPGESAYLKLSPSEAEFGSKSSELSRVEFAFRVGQKLHPNLQEFDISRPVFD